MTESSNREGRAMFKSTGEVLASVLEEPMFKASCGCCTKVDTKFVELVIKELALRVAEDKAIKSVLEGDGWGKELGLSEREQISQIVAGTETLLNFSIKNYMLDIEKDLNKRQKDNVDSLFGGGRGGGKREGVKYNSRAEDSFRDIFRTVNVGSLDELRQMVEDVLNGKDPLAARKSDASKKDDTPGSGV